MWRHCIIFFVCAAVWQVLARRQRVGFQVDAVQSVDKQSANQEAEALTLSLVEKENAQFLVQATFGPTRSDMGALRSGASKKDWVKSQFAVPIESHRAYYRTQANPLVDGAKDSRYPVRGACDENSRWTQYRKAPTSSARTGPIEVVTTKTAAQLEAAAKAKAGSVKKCGGWCNGKREPWSEKCTWKGCNGCGACPMEPMLFAILASNFSTCPFSKSEEPSAPVLSYHSGQRCPSGSSYTTDFDVCRMESQRVLTRGGQLPLNYKDKCFGASTFGCGYNHNGIFMNPCAPSGDKEETHSCGSVSCRLTRVCAPERELLLKAHGFEWAHEPRLELRSNEPSTSSTSGGDMCVRRSPVNEGSCRLDETCGISCGSPGEVANQPKLGHHFGFKTHLNIDFNYDDWYRMDSTTRYAAKSTVWVMQAVRAKDQVRQRMAWALSQIFVVGSGLNLKDPELWLNYYDVMVRHAFGNYRDILREVSYSPVMGKYLTHTGSSAFDYNGHFPNENFPREIMQLFSIGLVLLNEDGSPKLSDDGEVTETYSGANILSHSRVFTGFMNQPVRGNVEFNEENYIDPMYIDAEQHDFNPKVSLSGGYIGDGLPLCSEFGSVTSLAKGTRFELQAASKAEAPTLSSSSALFEVLCGSASGAEPCALKLWTEIREQAPCTGEECAEYVQVDGHSFQRIAPRCVSLYYQEGVAKVTVEGNGEIAVGEGDKKHSFFVYWGAAIPGAGEYEVTVEDKMVRFPGGESFRNPPVFYQQAGGDALRAAYDEVEEVLDHLFLHDNTPIFIATRLIQRFGISTPPAGYMRDVGGAFKSGKYDDIGSGNRGDLEATAAAILLAPDAAKPGQPSTTHGSLREPLLKIVHVLRSLEYKDTKGLESFNHEKISFEYLENLVGQFPFESPSVFNFFLADYDLPMMEMPMEMPEPESEEEEEEEEEGEEEEEEEEEMMNKAPQQVLAPELQILTPSYMMGYLNVMNTMLSYGVSHQSCHSTSEIVGMSTNYFGETGCGGGWGFDGTTDELDLLLTGGRLSAASKQDMMNQYTAARRRHANQLNVAAKYVVMSTEFNSLGETEPVEGEKRPFGEGEQENPSGRSYKAMVMVYMAGGADTFQMLVPQDCTMQDDYHQVRKDIALTSDELIQVTSVGQNCSKWGVHHRLSAIAQEYVAGRAAFVADIGQLTKPQRQGDWACSRLKSHSDQQRAAQRVQCGGGSGVGGRIAEALAKTAEVSPAYTVNSWSAAGSNLFGQSMSVKMEMVETMVKQFREYNHWKNELTNITTQVYANPYSNVYGLALMDALLVPLQVGPLLEGNKNLKTDWGSNCDGLCAEFQAVAKLIGARVERRAERDIFYTSQGGYDTHRSVKTNQESLWGNMNHGLTRFVAEMQAQNVWDEVVIFSSSEFGRTMDPNGGGGTDHGAAGNHFIMSGALQGGKIHNKFPSAHAARRERRDTGRGGLVPRHPWENMFVPLALWMGVPEGQLNHIFPSLENFKEVKDEYIIKKESLFK